MTCAVVSTLATLLVCPAVPALGAGARWGQVDVPGGVPAARRVLGLGDAKGRFDASLIPDFTYRHTHGGDWSRAEDKLRRYLTSVATIRAAVGDGTKGVGPPAATAPRAEADRFRDLTEALGIERRKVDGRLRYVAGSAAAALERAEWAGALGLDVEAIATRWTAGESETITLPTGVLPVPLPDLWSDGTRSAISLDDLLRDRVSGLFYTGLMALDEQTLAWFDGHRDVLRRVREQACPAFSAFARSLQVHDDTLVTAGGPRMAGVWERLTGRPPSDPSSFLAALLTIDDGLLMYFFDAVRHASPSVQQAIAESALARPASIDEIYRPFRAAGGAWSLEARPFDRPARDPAWTFSLLDLPGGRIGGPAWLPHILERVSSGADWTDKPIAIPTKVPVGDIDWTTRWLFDRPGDQLDRVKLLRFAQRLNGLDRATPDTADAALRTFRDLPALALALERMGIDDVDTVARAGRAGYTLSRAADRRIVEPILARWQASFGLVEQAARLRHVPASVTRPLILALADAASRPAREVTDRILHWTTEVFLPAVAPGADALRLDRESLVRITSADRSARERVTWEGLNYDRSPLRVARRNLDALTATPTSASADAGVLERLHRQLDQGFRSSDDARKMATELDGMRRLERPSLTGPPSEGRFSKQLGVAARTLRADPPIANGGTAPPPALEVSSVFGDAADDIVQPIVYALAMTPLHQTPALQVDAWTFHDLAAPEARDDWWRAAWQPATQQPRRGGGSGLVGSWLLLDLSLGEATVPRRFDRADSLATPVLDAIFREIALRAHPSDEQVDALGDAVRRLERGRVVLAQWQQSAPNGDDLARWDPRGVAIGATRRSALAWSLGHDVNAVGNLSVTEIAALGGPPRLAAMPIDGCVCVAAAPAWPLEDIRPYWMAGVPAAFATDLHLRVAELLTAAHLPLQLVADVLPLAAADWLSHVEPYANDDWEALTLWPKQLTLAEIEGYVMQLMADGILTPIDEAVP